MGLRKLERSVVKKHAIGDFKDSQDKYRITKYGEDNIPKNTMKKRQVHFDNSNQCFNAMVWQKNMIDTYMESLKEQKDEIS